jgi:hypothetical protein
MNSNMLYIEGQTRIKQLAGYSRNIIWLSLYDTEVACTVEVDRMRQLSPRT